MKKTHFIHDSLHGQILLSDMEVQLMSSDLFNRLHDIYQNSTAYLTFPSNRTKRFEHSLGTMKLASDLFYYSILNAENEVIADFYQQMKEQLNDIIRNYRDNVLIDNPNLESFETMAFDSFYKYLIPSNVAESNKTAHAILIQSIRLAALLHDIGHPPFSHVIEGALNKIYKNIVQEEHKTQRMQSFIKIFSSSNTQQQLHEKLGMNISDYILKDIVKNHAHRHIDDISLRESQQQLFEYLVYQCCMKILNDETVFEQLHVLISGSLDADRLDYVSRDMMNSGMDCGKIEYCRIVVNCKLQKLEYKNKKKKKQIKYIFALPIKTLNSIEDFLKRRFSLYKNIIYHHRVVKTDFLLKNCVEHLIMNYLKNDEAENTNIERALLPNDINGLWFPLSKIESSSSKKDVSTNFLNEERTKLISQWNDSWLIVVLRQIYYKKYYRKKTTKENTGEEYIISRQLLELLQYKKYYFSLIKRNYDYGQLDREISENINYKKIEKKIEQLDQLKENVGINIDPILDYLKNLKSHDERYILQYILSNKIIFDDEEEFLERIQNVVNLVFKKHFSNAKAYDIIVMRKKIKTGLDVKSPIVFYDDFGKLNSLDEVSDISKILALEENCRPVFYIYYLWDEEKIKIDNEEQKKNILKEIGENIGEEITDKIIKFMEGILDVRSGC